MTAIYSDDTVQWRSKNREQIDHLKDCSPIPITPEILENAGFIKGEIEFDKRYKWYDHKDYMDDMRFEVEPDGLFLKNCSISPIRYLHQLQNLFYLITGEELEINLNQ